MPKSKWWESWSPANVTLADSVPSQAWKACVLQGVYFGESEYNGKLGVRISSIFVLFITSLSVTLLPILARKWRVREIYYIIAKMFGSGVIVATAFIHLMDPAYRAIGPTSCVGMTGKWAEYSWGAALIMCGAIVTFLIDVYCSAFVASRYGKPGASSEDTQASLETAREHKPPRKNALALNEAYKCSSSAEMKLREAAADPIEPMSANAMIFRSQFYGFLILECGILLHSVMIGLSLGTTGNIDALYAAIAFHQAFEGLGIGARLSAIPFRPGLQWVPYTLCIVYALTTPIAIAVGVGLQSNYRENGYASLVVSGVLDSLAAGVLIYTGFVELVARDFIFTATEPPFWELNVQVGTFIAGAATMAIIGKWA